MSQNKNDLRQWGLIDAKKIWDRGILKCVGQNEKDIFLFWSENYEHFAIFDVFKGDNSWCEGTVKDCHLRKAMSVKLQIYFFPAFKINIILFKCRYFGVQKWPFQ